jgi:hypothetical protein
MKPESLQHKAISDYKRGDHLKHIAVRYCISVGTVSLWAKKAGLARRKRGRRHEAVPSDQALQIVAAVNAVVDGSPTLDELGRKFGYTRAGIHRIYHKWKNYVPKAPFEVGDIIRFAGVDFKVLTAGVHGGQVRALKTGKVTCINWWKNKSLFAVKL